MTNNYFSFPVTATRFDNLGFGKVAAGVWRFFDISSNRPSAVGATYATKAELLSDLQRYGVEWAG